MSRYSLNVTYQNEDATRIPDQVREGAALFIDLTARGLVGELASKFVIPRQGGYCGLDVVLFLLLYMTSGADTGVRKFWALVAPHSAALAALAGRKSLPSPASLSRALDAVDLDALRRCASWLLTVFTGVDTVILSPAAMTYDATGVGWHVFDFDPTVTTLRHRALPVGDDLPAARRRSEALARPGHAGRKRGDVQYRSCILQHKGSSVWVHAHASPGNGDVIGDLGRALDALLETCLRLGIALAQTLVRADGEYGNIAGIWAFKERGLHFVTRLNRPSLFDDPAVLERLRTGTWHYVPDSCSGPRRSAIDLGVFTLPPSPSVKRPNGQPYAPVTVRVVASRYPRDGKANRGRVLDGWQVELFAVDVDAEAWPASDCVAQFFGRASQENRFAQEDRELGLDRIVSYTLAGQELAMLVGLSLWNLRLARGAALNPPPAVRPPLQPRELCVDDRALPSWPRDPVVARLLGKLEWSNLLATRPGWAFEASAGVLCCPDGRPLTLTTVERSAPDKDVARAIFYRPSRGCEQCSARPACFQSARPSAAKHTSVTVPNELAEPLRQRLMRLRGEDPSPPRYVIEPITAEAGRLSVADPLFLPARARQDFQALFHRTTLHVEVTRAPAAPARPRLVATDVADRQRRRKTFAQNVARYALAEGDRVHLRVQASDEVRRWLGEPRQQRVAEQTGT